MKRCTDGLFAIDHLCFGCIWEPLPLLFVVFAASKKAAITRVIETPAHELALKAGSIGETISSGIGQLKEFCAAFTLILREYFEKRYRILISNPLEDLPGMLQKTDFPPEFVPGLKELLEQTDLVKFAKGQPREELYADSLIFARKVISETRLDLKKM
ncbi:MAG: hypothetical protein R2778_02365 [Saprospiraceae bacterium]